MIATQSRNETQYKASQVVKKSRKKSESHKFFVLDEYDLLLQRKTPCEQFEARRRDN